MHPMSQYPARPKLTNAMLLEAAKVIEARLGGDEYAGLAEDLAEIGDEHMDGYELCKELDGMGYDGSMSLAEALDNYGYELRKLREAAEKDWATTNNVQPPFPAGTKIKEGVIESVYTHGAAQYLVNYGHANRKRIINFEDARPVTDPLPIP